MEITLEKIGSKDEILEVVIDDENENYVSELLTKSEALELAKQFFAAAEKLFTFANREG